jgi:hypothetical protein
MAGLRKTGVRSSHGGGNVGFVKMLEKLFVRVRSWLHIDPAAVGQPAAGTVSGGGLSTGLAGPTNGFARSATGAGHAGNAGNNDSKASRHPTPPPPMPGEAFGDSSEMGLLMEAQPESGMVITESGIIIIDPNADEAKLVGKLDAIPSNGKPRPAQAVTADTAWALPNLAGGRSNGAEPSSSSSSSDWDAVLARARAQLSPASPPAPSSTKPRK